ncbi:MAG: RNA 2',3'-cyclic phosphodiesterase [Bacilli bacterium]|nr:RNA 2',3'-cyclic phosphodiesterase [Bacilli bacterium]MDD4076468.1 RNA 2',3'-cyclic phosphodiesterase [Bacilli bacterium]MDD4387804.1 RNA 2',3'-cyclic phosphodiesterase [Bacilli bacterium]
MRTFIGIKLNDCYNQIIEMQQEFKRMEIFGNYTLPENVHLTLLFLGELNQEEFKKVKLTLNQIEYSSFPVYIDKVKDFKDMMILEIRQSTELMQFQALLNRALTKENIYNERRPYYPHITLIRRCNYKINKEIALASTVNEAVLFSSERINNRLSYIPKHIIQLRGNYA